MPIRHSAAFESDALGQLPAGWTNVGAAGYVVGTDSPVTGSRSFGPSPYAALATAVYTGATATADACVQFSQRVLTTGTDGTNLGCLLRASADGLDGYAFLPQTAGDRNVNVFRKVAGAYAVVATGLPHGLATAAGDAFHFKCEAEGTALRWKAWLNDDPEPVAWAWAGTDAGVTAAGRFGLVAGENSAGSTSPGPPAADDLYWMDAGESVGYTQTRVTTGGVDLLVLAPRSGTPRGLVLYVHGAGETREALVAEDEGRKSRMRDALVAAGYVVAGFSAGTTNFGNDAAIAKAAAAHAYLLATYDLDVVLWPQSMGGALGFRMAHDPATFPRVRGVYAVYPVTSVLDFYDNSSLDLDAAILTAWGAADRAALATAVAGKHPVSLSAAGFPNIRYRFRHSAADTVVGKAANTDALRAVIAATTVRENALVTTLGEHGDATNFDGPDVVAFCRTAFNDARTTLTPADLAALAATVLADPTNRLAVDPLGRITTANPATVINVVIGGGA